MKISLLFAILTSIPVIAHAHNLNSVNTFLGRRHNWEHHVQINHMVTHYHLCSAE